MMEPQNADFEASDRREAVNWTDNFVSPGPELRAAVARICQRDRALAAIDRDALTVRRWQPGLASLVRVILGQQLSAIAARAIFQRLTQAIALTPESLAACPESVLVAAGLSRAKIATCKALAAAIVSGQLALETLPEKTDDAAIADLVKIRGIGAWTAEVYLLFCLDRLDIFPASDLALRRSYQTVKNLADCPSARELRSRVRHLSPDRGAAAHLLWHAYRTQRR